MHNVFPIIVGIDTPVHTDKQLQDIIDNNNNGFDYEKKHYTMYQGTQMQRKLETEIRKAKDEQVMAVSVDDEELIKQAQKRVTILNKKYNQLCEVSGLTPRTNRMNVSGYRRSTRK